MRVALVGRSNVGKSTLFKRLTGGEVITSSKPGTTRDVLLGQSPWGGVADLPGLEENILSCLQGWLLKDDRVFLVVDGKVGRSPLDADIARALYSLGYMPTLVVNKVESERDFLVSSQFYVIAPHFYTISALHGRGIEELMGARVYPTKHLPSVRWSIIGRPNVGKSSLVNALLGTSRVSVSEVSGTTRDAVFIPFIYRDRELTLVDTAGVRRRPSNSLEGEAVRQAILALRRSDVCCLVFDAVEGVQRQEARLAQKIISYGKGCVLVANKVDLLGKRRGNLQSIRQRTVERFPFLDSFPIVVTSAREQMGLPALLKVLASVDSERSECYISTGILNRWLRHTIAQQPPPGGVRLKYITQVGTKPPKFVIFVSRRDRLSKTYIRYLQNSLARNCEISGPPLELVFRCSTGERSGLERPKRRGADLLFKD